MSQSSMLATTSQRPLLGHRASSTPQKILLLLSFSPPDSFSSKTNIVIKIICRSHQILIFFPTYLRTTLFCFSWNYSLHSRKLTFHKFRKQIELKIRSIFAPSCKHLCLKLSDYSMKRKSGNGRLYHQYLTGSSSTQNISKELPWRNCKSGGLWAPK